MYQRKENEARDIRGQKWNEPDKSMRPKPIKTNNFPDENNFPRMTRSVTGSEYINTKEAKNVIPAEVKKLALRHTEPLATHRLPNHG